MSTIVPSQEALIRDANGQPTWRYRLEPFQRAFLESGLTAAEVEKRCGWASDGRLARILGLRAYPSRTRDGRPRQIRAKTLSYQRAVDIARALDLDFVEWEL